MSKRSPEAIGMTSGFNALQVGLLTWIGFVLALIGWALLIGGATVADMIAAKSLHSVAPSFHGDLLEIAECIIISGFGLAVVGALQSGFGTLNRFFGAVLMRSAQRDNEPSHVAEPAVERVSPAAASTKRRPYRAFADGSVEVDTIVGTRLFRTMAEAREFI